MLAVSQFDRIAVLGLGLIGGSLLRRLADYPIVGFDPDIAVRTAARAQNFSIADSVREAVAEADLVILAAPLPVFEQLIDQVTEHASSGTVLTDVASVKAPVLAAVRAAAGRDFRYVGGHPMAGTEESGFSASRADLFNDASYVLCVEQDTDLAAWISLATLISDIGCYVVPCSAAAHDQAVARISGLSHLFAAGLAIAGADGGENALALAAGSFRDGTRVAGSRPQFTAALCDQNRIELAQVLDQAIARLTAARESLGNGGSVFDLMNAGYQARQRWSKQSSIVTQQRIADEVELSLALQELTNAGAKLRVRPNGEAIDLEIVRPGN